MARSLEEIKHLRNKHHLTQKQLAQQAGVSQSLIAKIEAGELDPSFTKAQQIFEALDQLQMKKELKASDIMNDKVVFGQLQDTVKEAIKKMRSKGISQMPVLVQGNVKGIVTESMIIEKIASHPEKINTLQVKEVMEDTPPIVTMNTGQHTLLELLKEYPIVLVADKGEIKGIISKTDLLGKMG